MADTIEKLNVYDVNKDGVLSDNELRPMFGYPDDSILKDITDLIDKDNDGYISLQEYCALFDPSMKHLLALV